MKKTMILLAAMLMGMACHATDEVTVADVFVPQGGQTEVSICLINPDKSYTAGQMLLVLPAGVTSVLKTSGDPMVSEGERITSTNHAIGATHLEDGTDQFTLFSISSDAIPGTEGVLFSVTVSASSDLAVGAVLEGRLENIEMTTTDATPTPFNDQTFTITIGENRVVLDETSTTPPVAEENANVRVQRTILANEWSTICLPFDMTEAQVKAAFGDDVQLADFNDYEYDDAAGSISVKFTNVTAIEANHPYIIKVSEGMTEFTVDGVTIDPQEAIVDFDTSRRKNQPRQMVGTYVANTMLDWGTLFLSGNQFWYSVGNTKMKGYRAYFNFNDLLPDFEENYESRISMSFDNNTGIQDNKRETIDNKRCFDLQGRIIGNGKYENRKSAKGVYIVNGKKVIK